MERGARGYFSSASSLITGSHASTWAPAPVRKSQSIGSAMVTDRSDGTLPASFRQAASSFSRKRNSTEKRTSMKGTRSGPPVMTILAQNGTHGSSCQNTRKTGLPLKPSGGRSAQERVPKRGGKECVGVEDDDEGRRDHRARRRRLLQLCVVATELLSHPGELAQPCATVLVAALLECEHILDAQPAMLAGLPVPNLPFVQQPDEVLP